MEINVERLFTNNKATFITKHYRQFSFTSPRHYHNEFEIAYIENSCGKLYIGNTIANFNSSDLFLFSPRLIHAFKNRDDITKRYRSAKATIIFFKPDFFGNDFLIKDEARGLADLLKRAEEGIQFINPDPEVISCILTLSNKEDWKV